MQIIIAEEVVSKEFENCQVQEMIKRRPYIADEGEIRDILLEGPTHLRYNEEARFIVKSYSDGDKRLERDDNGDLILLSPDLVSNNILEGLAKEGNEAAARLLDEPGWCDLARLFQIIDEFTAIKDRFGKLTNKEGGNCE